MSECVLLDNNRLVFKNIVKTGSFKSLESTRRGDFYIPVKKEIDIIARDTYPSYEPAYQALYSFFRKTLGHEDDFSVYLCQLAFQIFSGGGLLSDYMDMLHQMEFEFQSEKNVNDFAAILMNVNNETRMAELCGHKPNEMAKLRTNTAKAMKPAGGQKAAKRIYPNEPCPCGSGKKYKKCCGR